MNNQDENLVHDDNLALDEYATSSSSDTTVNSVVNKTAQILYDTFNASTLPGAIVESLKAVDESLDQDIQDTAAGPSNQTFIGGLYNYLFNGSWTAQLFSHFQSLFDSLSLLLVYFFEWLSTTPLSKQASVSFEIKILSGLLFILFGLIVCLIVVWSLFGSTIKHFYSNQEVYKYTPTQVYDRYFPRNYVSINKKKRKIN